MTTAEKIFTVPKKTTISSLAINHGGTAVATGFSEGHIIGGVLIYEVPTGCLFGRLPVKECRRLSFARSADCLAVSTANDVTLWDWKNAKQLQRIAVANTAALALSPDGELVATVANNILTFWNARDAKAVHTIEDVESFWSPLAFDAQQKRAAFVGRKTRLVKVIDLESGKVVHHFQGSGEITSSLVFHPTEPLLAAGGWDKQVAVWDLKTGVQARKIRGCTDDIGAVAFSETGQWIHTVDRTRVVKTWDALLDQPARRVPIAAAWKGAIDRAGNRLAVTSYDTSLHVIDLRTGKTWSERSPKDPPNCVAFSPDGAILATAGTTGVITLWDPLTGKRLAALPEEGTDWPMVTLAWSPDGKRIATGGQGRQASVWDVVGRRKLFDLGGHSQSVTNVVFSGDGKRLVSGSGGTLYMVWGKGPDGAPLPKDRFKGQLQDIKIWDATTGLLITSIDGLDAKSEGLAINADGSLVTATFADGSVRVFDANTGRLARAFRGELKGLLTLAYHPTDKNCLLTGYANGAVKVWDVEMGREICTLGQHRTQITSLAFTADGTKLVTVGNSDSDVKVWDTMPLK
jgi:WD40 repeat protein